MDTIKIPCNTYWYNLISNGVVNFDYRLVKPYWVKRLTSCKELNESNALNLKKHLIRYKNACFYIPYTSKKYVVAIKDIKITSGSEFCLPTGLYFLIYLNN